MSPKCGVCNENESKYKCPKCGVRYCSLACYKPHKASHGENNETSQLPPVQPQPQPHPPEQQEQVPGPAQEPPKPTNGKLDFTGFEKDPELQRLLARYTYLKPELQLIFGLTLEPGPDEAYTWNKQKWFDDSAATPPPPRSNAAARGRGRGRGGRGRGRGGFPDPHVLPPEERMHGAWTQAKGDEQGRDVMRKLRESRFEELSEGMREFVKLCGIRFER